MFSSIHTGLTGLIAFSRGLDVISNNVANLNTPGFKRSDLQFQDLLYRYTVSGENNENRSALQIGNGVQAHSSTINFSQGELRTTGGDTDVAIDGNGYFIVSNDDGEFYTRSGQFQFDQNGFLVTSNGLRVAGFNSSGLISDINIDNLLINTARQSTKLEFRGNLSTGSNSHNITNINIYDNVGNVSQLSITFTNNFAAMPGSWLVEVRDQNSNIIVSGSEIRFQGNGSPDNGFNTIDFTYTSPTGSEVNLSLDFGLPGLFTGATSFSAGQTSDLILDAQDGYGVGAITNVTFNTDGQLIVNYSNAQSTRGSQLALAYFQDIQSLRQDGNSIFMTTLSDEPVIGRAGVGPFGTISGGSIELSNVDLTEQFTGLIIVQRGFQASSQVLTVANEMIQQLLDDSRQAR